MKESKVGRFRAMPVGTWPEVFCAAAIILAAPMDASAEPIPRGMEERVLALFRPYGVDPPADTLPGGAILDAVRIEQESVVVVLVSGATRGTLTVAALRDAGATRPNETSRSFAMYLDRPATVAPLSDGAQALVGAIRANDDGTFWQSIPVPDEVGITGPAPEIDTGFGPVDFIGEAALAALLTLLLLSWRAFRPLSAGFTLRSGIGFAWVLAGAVALRVWLAVPEPGEAPRPDQACSSAVHCDDFNPCTVDACVDQLCVSEWAPGAGTSCCARDADCPRSEDPCTEVFCDTAFHRCADRPACTTDSYAGSSRPTMDTSMGWLLSVPAKWLGNTARTAEMMNSAASAGATILVGLLVLAWGGAPSAALSASFLWAVYPASLTAALSPSMSGTMMVLGLLSLLAWGLLLRSPWPRCVSLPLAAAASLALFLVVMSRPEYALIIGPMGIAFAAQRNIERRPAWLLWAPAASAAAGLALFLGLRSYGPGLPVFPQLAVDGFGESVLRNLDWLFVSGLPIPVFLSLLALAGLPLTARGNRPFGWLLLSMLPLLVLPAFLFSTDQGTMVRITLLPSISLVICAGQALAALGKFKVRFAWMAVAALVVYFAVFPLQREREIQGAANASAIESHLHQP